MYIKFAFHQQLDSGLWVQHKIQYNTIQDVVVVENMVCKIQLTNQRTTLTEILQFSSQFCRQEVDPPLISWPKY
jgi:hypothetical protein